MGRPDDSIAAMVTPQSAVRELRTNTNDGAALLARRAIMLLRSFVAEAPACDLAVDARRCAESLRAARPAMGAVGNLVGFWIDTFAWPSDGFRRRAIAHCDSVAARADRAKAKTVRAALDRLSSIPPDGVVLTHSASSTVRAVLAELPCRLLATASVPGGEGRRLAAELGIGCVEDGDATAVVAEVDAVVVGADAVGLGTFVNKVGTHALARAAQQCSTPFFVGRRELQMVRRRQHRPAGARLRAHPERLGYRIPGRPAGGVPPMLRTLAVANYRSLRDLVLPLASLNLVTGPNGSGKSNLYKGLRLLSETAFGTAVESLAGEGGIESVLWAGPEQFSKAVRKGDFAVQGGPRRKPVNLRFGFAGDDFSYAIDYGLPTPTPTMFGKDPEIKREVIWHGGLWHPSRALVDRRGPVVSARDADGRWQVIEHHLPSYDSMLTRLADPNAPGKSSCCASGSARGGSTITSAAMRPPGPHAAGGHPHAGAQQRRTRPRRRLADDRGDRRRGRLDRRRSGRLPGRHRGRGGCGRPVQPALPASTASCGRVPGRTVRRHPALPAVDRRLADAPAAGLMVLNEPETSLHPDLLPALGRLMKRCAENTQLWVTTHAESLIGTLTGTDGCNHLELGKELGETSVLGFGPFDAPAWRWPAR